MERLKSETEEAISEEQAGFRSGRSTIQQTLSLRLITEKYREVDKHVLHCFIDFSKAFDLVWHEGLWQVLKSYGVNGKLIRVLKTLCEQAT